MHRIAMIPLLFYSVARESQALLPSHRSDGNRQQYRHCPHFLCLDEGDSVIISSLISGKKDFFDFGALLVFRNDFT